MEEQNPFPILDLPFDTRHYDCLLGGHTHEKGSLKLGVLKHKNGNVLKPYLDEDIRSAQELSFYEKVFKNPDNDPLLRDLQNFIPHFYGTLDCTIRGTKVKYLCIEDVCGHFLNPSVLSVKIGRVVWEPTATPEKIEKEFKKYPQAATFGFRIQGMKVYDYSNKIYNSKDKLFGRGLITYEEVQAGIKSYLNAELGQINILILSGFLHWLLKLKEWFHQQRKFVFISSSLVLVYEGNFEPWRTWLSEHGLHVANGKQCQNPNNSSSKCQKALHKQDCNPISKSVQDTGTICSECKLNKLLCSDVQNSKHLFRISGLDFAHVLPTKEEDSNFVFGLDKFIVHIQSILELYF